MTSVSAKALRIRLQHGWFIELGIKRDREQVPIRGSLYVIEQQFLCVTEVARHFRTKVRQRTTCKDESNRQRLPLELCGRNGLAEFIRKMILRECVAHLQGLH